MQDALQAAGLPPDDCVVGTEDLLPACIFTLVRARVPRLYSQARSHTLLPFLTCLPSVSNPNTTMVSHPCSRWASFNDFI